MSQLVFSGHETFHCRQYWLKKGYDFLKSHQGQFNQVDAVVELGVGKNMVSAINYWLNAFGLIENKVPTKLANWLLGEEGRDPFLENPASIWLLHYQLVNTDYASIYPLVFNEIKGDRVEFSWQYLAQQIEAQFRAAEKPFSVSTIEKDIKTFRKNYVRPDKIGDVEDDLSSLLIEINLVKEVGDGKIHERSFKIESLERDEIPHQLILFAILRHNKFKESTSIAFQDLLNGNMSPGRLFALSANGLMNKIEEIVNAFPEITYSSDAGIQQLSFLDESIKEKSFNILNEIYV